MTTPIPVDARPRRCRRSRPPRSLRLRHRAIRRRDQRDDRGGAEGVVQAKGQAKLDRLDQDDTQKRRAANTRGKTLPKDVATQHREGESRDDPLARRRQVRRRLEERREDRAGRARHAVLRRSRRSPPGRNCYACHQLAPQEVSFGTIGPSLYQFGKLRGYSDETRKYAYGKIYNAEAYSACTNMPRFGHTGILTEQQIKDVVALLVDPDSPVNK